jgi:hypothetical protein
MYTHPWVRENFLLKFWKHLRILQNVINWQVLPLVKNNTPDVGIESLL